jgi:hypothetical protein
MARRISLASVLVTALLAAGPANAEAARNPISSVKVSGAVVPAGTTVALTARARRGAPKRLTVLLSRDRRRGRGDKRIGSLRVKRGRAKGRAKVPAATAAGPWFVLVCGKGRACRAAKQPIEVPSAGASRVVNVTPQLDAASAVTQTVGRGGGTLSAAGPDGTRYALAIPADALPEDTTITMTPLTGVGGLPAGTFAGGVDLKPDGLLLYRSATLTVTPAKAVPVKRQAAYAYAGAGEGFHMVPATGAGPGFTIPVNHFTGIGGADVPTPNLDKLEAAAPLDARGRAEADAAAILRAAKDGRISEQDAFAYVADIIRDYYDQQVKPRRGAALQDDDAGRSYVSEVLGLARQLALLGAGNGDVVPDLSDANLFPLIGPVVEASYQRHQKACAEKHDLKEVGTVLSRDHELLLLGAGHTLQEDLKCVSFRLEVDSLIVDTGHDDSADGKAVYTYHIQTAFQLSLLDEINSGLHGAGRWTWDVASGDSEKFDEDCGGTTQNRITGAAADEVDVPRAVIPIDDAPISLLINVHKPVEHYIYEYFDGECNKQQIAQDGPVWATGYSRFHADERVEEGVYSVTKWTRHVGQELYADKVYDRHLPDPDNPDADVTELTTLRLIHTPQR